MTKPHVTEAVINGIALRFMPFRLLSTQGQRRHAVLPPGSPLRRHLREMIVWLTYKDKCMSYKGDYGMKK